MPHEYHDIAVQKMMENAGKINVSYNVINNPESEFEYDDDDMVEAYLRGVDWGFDKALDVALDIIDFCTRLTQNEGRNGYQEYANVKDMKERIEKERKQNGKVIAISELFDKKQENHETSQ